MSSSNDMKGMYKNLDPTFPDCQGFQYANDAATPEYLDVTYDEFNNEQAEDRPMHANTTAGKGSYNFSGGHYSKGAGSFGGYGGYGVAVKDQGQSTKVDKVTVDNSRADRGKEA